MKKMLFLVGTLLTTAGAFAQTTAAEPAGLATAFCKAIEAEDAAALTAITTDDFTITSFDGQTADRDLLSQALSGAYLVTETMPANNIRSRTYNGNTAIVTGDSKFKGALQGTNFNANVVFIATCVKVGNNWKIASFQLSGMPGGN
ncbi:nuclear transport factor 2 family protein [Fibrella sp. WM1]|uniref:nuclear transport factor 2 family protein n=1 Tax=Fibrella musci TaxID=3242485 RepID=UPI00351FB1BC